MAPKRSYFQGPGHVLGTGKVIKAKSSPNKLDDADYEPSRSIQSKVEGDCSDSDHLGESSQGSDELLNEHSCSEYTDAEEQGAEEEDEEEEEEEAQRKKKKRKVEGSKTTAKKTQGKNCNTSKRNTIIAPQADKRRKLDPASADELERNDIEEKRPAEGHGKRQMRKPAKQLRSGKRAIEGCRLDEDWCD